jgi:hypothetical protein
LFYGEGRIPSSNAQLYQDILLFSLNLKEYHPEANGTFRVRELARWLIQNHKKYRDEYQSSKKNFSERIEDRLDTIKTKVKDLIKLDLIEHIGTAPQSKGSGVVGVFRYKIFAYLLGSSKVFLRQSAKERTKKYSIFSPSLFSE